MISLMSLMAVTAGIFVIAAVFTLSLVVTSLARARKSGSSSGQDANPWIMFSDPSDTGSGHHNHHSDHGSSGGFDGGGHSGH